EAVQWMEDLHLVDDRNTVRCITAKGAADKLTRKEIDKLTEFVKTYGAKGLAYTRVTAEAHTSSFEKFLSEDEVKAIHALTGLETGDVLLIVADKNDTVYASLGALRKHLAEKLELFDKSTFDLLWVTDFPLFEYSEEEDRYVSKHHPFTHPYIEDIDKMESDPGAVRSIAYDLVINGYEAGGGSIRIHDQGLQKKMFKALGFTEEEAMEKFGFLMGAFQYGAPPHGGLAFGLDRLCMILSGTENIKDVIAFPKVQNASELMTQCPAEVEPKALQELHIKIAREPEQA
ncbi:MAG: Asp-tRNA(Asn)/Glu-tRNA(Gln) amidotransferase GatCAB subunit C, partial [Oscillospiraceae bacterium]|nr:Asp-tRNA(Asn)/Glu-tRNA(Gln) amidotransferase GatCAB subunit C [Oscillospiraceae bacterium]